MGYFKTHLERKFISILELKYFLLKKKTKGFKVIRYYKINRNGEKQEISAHARCNAIDQQIRGPK